jgi:hypothetical protein
VQVEEPASSSQVDEAFYCVLFYGKARRDELDKRGVWIRFLVETLVKPFVFLPRCQNVVLIGTGFLN